MERVYVGVVGELQYDVLESRMKSEYGVDYRKYPLQYSAIRRLPDGVDPKNLRLFDVKWVQDFRGKNYLLFNNEWHVGNTLQNNEGLVLEEFGQEQTEE